MCRCFLIVVTTTWKCYFVRQTRTLQYKAHSFPERACRFITFSLKLVLTKRVYSIAVYAMSFQVEYLLRDTFCHKKLCHCFNFFFFAFALSRVGSTRAHCSTSRDIFSPGREAAGCLGFPPPVSSLSAFWPPNHSYCYHMLIGASPCKAKWTRHKSTHSWKALDVHVGLTWQGSFVCG